MKIDFKRFKKVASGPKSTTLQHADGHRITIAHDAISPKLVKDLHALPMSDGGKVEEKAKEKNSPSIDPDKAKEISDSAKKSGWNPAGWTKNIKEGLGLANGGQVPAAEQLQQPDQETVDEYVKVPRQLLQQHVQQMQAPAQQGVPQVSPEEEGIQSYNPIDTLADLAKIAGLNIQKNMQADTELYKNNPQAWMQKQASNIATGSIGSVGGGAGKAALAEGELANAAKPANFMQRAAIEKAEQEAARRAAGKFNATEANALGEGIQPASQVAEKIAERTKKPKMADGGEVNPKLEQSKKEPSGEKSYADGGDVEAIDMNDMGGEPPASLMSSNMIPGMDQQASPQMMPGSAPIVPAIGPQTMPMQSPQQEEASPEAPAQSANPSTMGGYGNIIQGIEQGAQAQGQLGADQAKIFQAAQKQQQEQLANYQVHLDSLEKERQALTKDIANGHVDPDKYWDNHSKLAAGLGIILAGISPVHGPNGAVDFINHQIDRSLKAQADNLQSKQNLLSANLHQFGNMNSAMTMTRVMMNDMAMNKLQAAAANAQSPMAQANAMKLIGQLQMQTAPMVQRLALMQSLGNPAGQEAGKQHDPTMYVPMLVPQEHQKAVFKEIQDAQNIRTGSKEGMDAFDKATQEQRVLSKNILPGVNSPYVGKLKASVLPQFQNIDGTVRQAAMDAFLPTITPQVGDSKHTVDVKRQTLQDWYVAHSAAPTAKAYGIDLDKFNSTTTNPIANLSPQQQSFVKWAKENPSDPKAQMLLKKLGVH